jgi:hypothetical protein
MAKRSYCALPHSIATSVPRIVANHGEQAIYTPCTTAKDHAAIGTIMAKGQQRKNKEASKQKAHTDEIGIERSHNTTNYQPTSSASGTKHPVWQSDIATIRLHLDFVCKTEGLMLRLGFGLVLVGLVTAAQATQPDEDYFVPKLDLLTTRFAHSGTGLLPAYQFSVSVVFARPSDTAPIGSGFGSTSRFPPITRSQQEIARTTNFNWQQVTENDRISLSHRFRFEFREEQINITVHPHAVLIDGERFKIRLQPHSTSILWSKPF